MKRKKLLIIGSIIAIAILAYLLVSQTGPIPQSGKGEGIQAALENQLDREVLKLKSNEIYQVNSIRVGGDWAFAEAELFNEFTGQQIAPGGSIFIFHKENGVWKMATPGTDLYRSWLEKVPTTLMPEDLKIFLR